ncbi:DNA alkylation repair protein [Bailinhaonella thermotolerans]|uniref:DNA alkylation repair protein n=1 Tax=Bailinhaonella thermotolerans TaxID=1070861 RepID=A0A3A4ADU5_9ACTN|nr:DNA alkylation repair protein [Bailinhaonella thermotolerans]RJL26611.1 DNA alkylation repair protein [Bailinhaonella thermotolerans]
MTPPTTTPGSGGAAGELIAEVRRALEAAADPAKAAGMTAYLRSSMPMYGVSRAPARAVCAEVFAAHPLDGFAEWRDTALALWRGATRREELYAAIDLTGHRLYRRFQTPETLPMYDEMIVTGAWWDLVDEIAVQRVGPLLRAYPDDLRPLLLRWSRDPDLWRRRTAILAQNKFKGDTDLGLLYTCLEGSIGDPDFFARKAIGWALREYAKTDPDEVRRYVAENRDRLSPLSRREALKNLG